MQVESPSTMFSFNQTASIKNTDNGVASQPVAPKNCSRTAESISSIEELQVLNDDGIWEVVAQHASTSKSHSSTNCTTNTKSVGKRSVAPKNVTEFGRLTLPNKVRIRVILAGSIVVPSKLKPTQLKVSKSKSSTKKSVRMPALLEYVMKGILIPGTGVLSARGMENEVAADLTTDGKIVFNGVTYTSPSSFARVPQRKPKCNGWVNTMYAQPGTPWKSLEDIRTGATKKGAVSGKICWKSTTSAPPKKVVSGARRQKKKTKPHKTSAPVPTSASARTMAEIRRCWTPRIQLTARQPEFNWQFYETETHASPPLQTTTPKFTSSPTEAPKGGGSAAVTKQEIPHTNKSTANKFKRRKFTARKSSSYYTARYHDYCIR